MTKAELCCMKKLAIQPADRTANLRVEASLVTSATIDCIANNGVFQPRKMHANLMSASGLQFDIKQRKSIENFASPEQRYRSPSAAHDCHARAIARIARDWLIDFAAAPFNLTVHQRKVRFENFTRAKLIGE